MRNSYCFIDAFNVLHHAVKAGLRRNTFQSIMSLITDIEKMAAHKGYRAFVVFDGSRFKDQFVSTKWAQIITTDPPETADDRIEFMLESYRHTAHCTVITDDRTLGNMAVGYNARWISTASWFLELSSFSKQNLAGGKERTSNFGFFNAPFRNHPDFQ